MRTPPRLVLTSTQTATTYAFRAADGAFGWAHCIVNDATGGLHISSDWGTWSHRWDPRPSSLGAQSLTAFIGTRGSVDYLANKLHNKGALRRRWSAEATARSLRRRLWARRLDDGRAQFYRRLDPKDMPGGKPPSHLSGLYTADGLPIYSHRLPAEYRAGQLPFLTREEARRIWDELDATAQDCDRSSDLFYERIQQLDGFTDYVTDDPWEYAETEQTPEDRALRDIVLPALIEACRTGSTADPQREAPALPDRRTELVKRIAQNKAWLSDNWHQGKDMRRPCQANLEADEQELARLDARAL